MSAPPRRRPLSRPERLAWARLARTPSIGPVTFHRLLARWRTPLAALDALLSDRRGAALTPPPLDAIERELDAVEHFGAVWIASCEPDYPALLQALPSPPPLLCAIGDLALGRRPAVGLVGGREASAAGQALAAQLAEELGARGYVIVSGLARGVDAAAHAASLKTGTIAVLAGGVDQPYPPQNRALYDEIAARALILGDAPFGAPARAKDFPRRNTLIAGLSQGIVVVEAALRSGSLITARAALDMDREVMAAPGSPLDPRARGANALIKQGAALVEDADDIVAVLEGPGGSRPGEGRLDDAWAPSDEDAPLPASADGDAARIAALLSPTPVHLNVLARLAGVSPSTAAGAVVELELAGRAVTTAGGYVASAPVA
jgi:DNA processing protein